MENKDIIDVFEFAIGGGKEPGLRPRWARSEASSSSSWDMVTVGDGECNYPDETEVTGTQTNATITPSGSLSPPPIRSRRHRRRNKPAVPQNSKGADHRKDPATVWDFTPPASSAASPTAPGKLGHHRSNHVRDTAEAGEDQNVMLRFLQPECPPIDMELPKDAMLLSAFEYFAEGQARDAREFCFRYNGIRLMASGTPRWVSTQRRF